MKTKRLMALDVLRGLTILLMIIVNNPGSWSHVYAPLLHSKWDGITPTDLVFPFFLFIVGAAMWYSFKKFDHQLTRNATGKILWRTALIFLIGLLLNAFPFYNLNIGSLRIMGVLQRIALAYGFASFIVLLVNKKGAIITSSILLLGYWGILVFFGGDGALSLEGNVIRQVDLSLFGASHIYHGYGIPFDPEGLLSTAPAIVNVVIGYQIGQLIDEHENKMKAVSRVVIVGLSLTILGLLWNTVFPINKPIWSSSYVLVTCGLASLLLALLLWVIDIREKKKWAHPLLVYGMNPLFIYVLAWIWAGLMSLIQIPSSEGTTSIKSWMYNELLVPWAGNLNASLIFALHLGILFWLVGLWLYRKKVFIKI